MNYFSYCLVLKKNTAVIKLHRKFGFIDETCIKVNEEKFNDDDFVHLKLDKERWLNIKEKFKGFD